MLIRGLILFGLLGVISFGAIYFAFEPGAETETSRQAAAVAPYEPPLPDRFSVLTIEAPAGDDARPGVLAPAPEIAAAAPAVRNVTPANMTAAPPVTVALTRVEQPAPPPPPPEPARKALLYNPLFLSAGVLKVADREIHLAGIEAPDADKLCGDGAEAWPCGTMARAALRRFIRGRAIACEVPAGAKKLPDPVRCALADEDLSEWLVAQGWAEPTDDSFKDAEKAARDKKLGLWSEKRPDQADDVATSG